MGVLEGVQLQGGDEDVTGELLPQMELRPHPGHDIYHRQENSITTGKEIQSPQAKKNTILTVEEI